MQNEAARKLNSTPILLSKFCPFKITLRFSMLHRSFGDRCAPTHIRQAARCSEAARFETQYIFPLRHDNISEAARILKQHADLPQSPSSTVKSKSGDPTRCPLNMKPQTWNHLNPQNPWLLLAVLGGSRGGHGSQQCQTRPSSSYESAESTT